METVCGYCCYGFTKHKQYHTLMATNDKPLLVHAVYHFFTCMGFVSKMQNIELLVENHLFGNKSISVYYDVFRLVLV